MEVGAGIQVSPNMLPLFDRKLILSFAPGALRDVIADQLQGGVSRT